MMTIFSRKRSSSLALAIALATGSAVVATAVFPTEASAQRNRDKKDKEKEADGGGYGDDFRAAYLPLEEAMKAEGSDLSGMTGQLQTLGGLLNTSDEKIAGGNLIYRAATQIQNPALQIIGMEAMLASGKVPAEALGQYNVVAYNLLTNAGEHLRARPYLQAAIDNNYTNASVTAETLQLMMAENFFAAGDNQGGLAYLKDKIAARKGQGLVVPEQWYRRGVAVTYSNEIVPDVYDFATMWVGNYSTQTNWTDAINIVRNLNSYESSEMLDLFRLSRKVGALTSASDYDYYVEVADPRRLPNEVIEVINQGMAAGVVASSNAYITDSLAEAKQRVAADRSDLPALERDANAANAGLRTVVAAGDTFLSYSDYQKAVGFYQKALGMPGVDTNEVLTRLGIAQIGVGDYAGATESLARVSGNRMPLARLWSIYAEQMAETGSTASTAEPAMDAS